MVCDICGKEGARVHKTSRTYGKGKDILIIEDIFLHIVPQLRDNIAIYHRDNHGYQKHDAIIFLHFRTDGSKMQI